MSSSTALSEPLRHYQSPNIPMAAIRRYARQIGERFRPDQVILFGSYAYGTPHEDSDVDLLVVMPAWNELAKAGRIRWELPAPFAMDLLVRTPKDLQWRLAEGQSFFREIMSRGKVLYESDDPVAHSRAAGLIPAARTAAAIAAAGPLTPPGERRMKKSTTEWVNKAEEDWEAARQIRKSAKPLHGAVCFHGQQCAEKYLKALMEELGLTIRKTHELGDLLSVLLPHHPTLRPLGRGLRFLKQFAVDIRYPQMRAKKRQAVAASSWAGRVRTTARTLLGLGKRRRRRKKRR